MEHQSCMVTVRNLMRKALDILYDENSSEKTIAMLMQVILACLAFKRTLLMDKTQLKEMVEDIKHEKEMLEFEDLSSNVNDSQRVFR